jgi:hypothetical protein
MFQLFHDVPGLCRVALELVCGRPFENLSQGTARQATLLNHEVLGYMSSSESVEERADDNILARCSIAEAGYRTLRTT